MSKARMFWKMARPCPLTSMLLRLSLREQLGIAARGRRINTQMPFANPLAHIVLCI